MKSFEIGKTKTGNLPNDLKSAFIWPTNPFEWVKHIDLVYPWLWSLLKNKDLIAKISWTIFG
jgi:hypothetical protein